MIRTVSIQEVEHDLRALFAELRRGDALTVVDDDGTPIATVVGLRENGHDAPSDSDWMAEWDALSEKVSAAWKGTPDAVEAIREQRR